MGDISYPGHGKEGPLSCTNLRCPNCFYISLKKKKTKTAAELGMVVHTWSPNI